VAIRNPSVLSYFLKIDVKYFAYRKGFANNQGRIAYNL